jgi:Rad3-related DNA helicase
MRAEFASAKSPAFLVMTPWMFEGIELPPESVDRLVLQVMPFDHPSHAVIGRRAARFRDPFSDYSLPRLKHRLFRLMRTFRKHAKHDAIVDVLDDRLRTKAYGKEVAGYLQMLIPNQAKGQVEKGGQMAIGF